MTTTQPKPASPRGRPALAPGAGRIARVPWRTTAERKARAVKAAEAAGVPLSVWLDHRVDLST